MRRRMKGYGIFGVFILAVLLFASVKPVQAAGKPAKITSAKAVSGEKVIIKAKVSRKVPGGKKYYLVKVNGMTNKPVCALASSKKKSKLTFTLSTKDKVHVISKFGIAVKKGKSFKLISNTRYLNNPEMTAFNTSEYTLPSSKKGMHGLTDFNLDAKHALTTVNLNELIGNKNTGTPYVYNGKTYYFTNTRQMTVENFVKEGICVTMVVFMNWNASNKSLIYPTGRQQSDHWYMVNTLDNKARETLEAAFCYLAETFSQPERLVSNWVVGNEVNSQQHWNHAANVGNISLSTYVKAYVQEFQMLSSAVRSCWPEARVFVPLDNAWNIPASTMGWNGKTFLTEFVKTLKKENKKTKWNLAYHAYALPLTAPSYGDQLYVTNSPDSYYITPLNIEQLTNYIKNTYGSSTRIILSEEGYTSKLGERKQAASILYAYYKAEFNPMVDAFIIRCEKDNAIEAAEGYYFGLSDENGKRREAYQMFKYMDTRKTAKYAKKYLRVIGASSWKSIVPGYKASRFR